MNKKMLRIINFGLLLSSSIILGDEDECMPNDYYSRCLRGIIKTENCPGKVCFMGTSITGMWYNGLGDFVEQGDIFKIKRLIAEGARDSCGYFESISSGAQCKLASERAVELGYTELAQLIEESELIHELEHLHHVIDIETSDNAKAVLKNCVENGFPKRELDNLAHYANQHCRPDLAEFITSLQSNPDSEIKQREYHQNHLYQAIEKNDMSLVNKALEESTRDVEKIKNPKTLLSLAFKFYEHLSDFAAQLGYAEIAKRINESKLSCELKFLRHVIENENLEIAKNALEDFAYYVPEKDLEVLAQNANEHGRPELVEFIKDLEKLKDAYDAVEKGDIEKVKKMLPQQKFNSGCLLKRYAYDDRCITPWERAHNLGHNEIGELIEKAEGIIVYTGGV